MDRRAFLKKGMGSATAAALILTVKDGFANALETLDRSESTDWRAEYLLDPGVTYFNHGSIGTMPKAVHAARQKYLNICETNPWFYIWNKPWLEPLKNTREKVAQFLNCQADEIVFNHNTTEGFNLLASGLKLSPNDEVLFSSLNHSGASQCWFHYAPERGYQVRQFEIPLNEVKHLNMADVVALYNREIRENTQVLVLPHIDNTVGLLHPIKEISKMAREKGVRYIAVDGAQSVGMMPVDLQALDVDFYAMSPHKWLQSPKGTGLLYLRKSVQADVKPFWVTWGQKSWKDTVRIFEDYGTRNWPEVLTLAHAVEFQEKLTLDRTTEMRRKLREYLLLSVREHSKIQWRSPLDDKLNCSLYSLEVIGTDSRELAGKLFQENGIVVRAFHSVDVNMLRLSPNFYNTKAEIDHFLKSLDLG